VRGKEEAILYCMGAADDEGNGNAVFY